jgi:hypothetical protein
MHLMQITEKNPYPFVCETQKRALREEMERKIADIEAQKTSLEERAQSNEDRMQNLRQEPVTGSVRNILASLQEEKSNLARKADEAMIEVQVGGDMPVCVFF